MLTKRGIEPDVVFTQVTVSALVLVQTITYRLRSALPILSRQFNLSDV